MLHVFKRQTPKQTNTTNKNTTESNQWFNRSSKPKLQLIEPQMDLNQTKSTVEHHKLETTNKD